MNQFELKDEALEVIIEVEVGNKMNTGQCELSDGASWYPYRLNVVPFGGTFEGRNLSARYVDSLDEARTIKACMLGFGAGEVRIYDTVEGTFYD